MLLLCVEVIIFQNGPVRGLYYSTDIWAPKTTWCVNKHTNTCIAVSHMILLIPNQNQIIHCNSQPNRDIGKVLHQFHIHLPFLFSKSKQKKANICHEHVLRRCDAQLRMTDCQTGIT